MYAYLSNHMLSDDLSRFIFKSRMQLLECNSLLHKYYPHIYPKSCPMCNNPFETVSHIMNGCMVFHNQYVARHNRIVSLILGEVLKRHPHMMIYSDQIITGDMLEANCDLTILQHRKPDLLVCDRVAKRAFIVEVACPFDAFLDNCYNTKFDKYCPLNEMITLDTPYECKTIAIIIGSLGSVHRRVVPGMKLMGFSNRHGKAIAKYISISATIGSNKIWKKRAVLYGHLD